MGPTFNKRKVGCPAWWEIFVKNQKKIYMKTKIKHVLNTDKSWNFDKSNAENYVFKNISGPNSLRMFFMYKVEINFFQS